MKKILVIAPHPDDEIIGCGGSILKHIKNGNKVYVIFIGYLGTIEREKEAKRVKKISGIKKINFLRIKEPFEFNKGNLIKLIEAIRKIDPNIIYIPHELDGDRDHLKTHELSREAIWMSRISIFGNRRKVCKNKPIILLYEIHKPLSEVNYYEDISDFIDKKISLIKEYKSQVRLVDYPFAIAGLNMYRGVMGMGTKYAEAFKIKKWQGTLLV